jgi:hypothetical protein
MALLFACASGPDVRVDYDRSTDFAQYKTFGFVETPSGGPDWGLRFVVTLLFPK